jgi:hypothetical protein
MNIFSSADGNRFEAKLKISHNNNQKELLEIINNFLKKYYKNDSFFVEKETPNILILNFKDNTNMANCVLRYLKLIKLEKIEFANITCSVSIKILNNFTKIKNYNKPKLLLSSLSIYKNERYKDVQNTNKDNKTSNNTKYNVIENLYFLNDSNKNKINNNNNNKNISIDTENSVIDSIIEYNYFPKKNHNHNWLIQNKVNKAKSMNNKIKNIKLDTDINKDNQVLEYTNKNVYNYN